MQGPHQVATNSTKTGRSDSRTVLENSLSPISLIPPHLIAELENFLLPLPPELKESRWRLAATEVTWTELTDLTETEVAEEHERTGGVRYDRIRIVELETIESMASPSTFSPNPLCLTHIQKKTFVWHRKESR